MSVRSVFLLCVVGVCCGATPLDDYVNRPDPTYAYKEISQTRGATYTTYILNMTSQTWKSSEVTDQSVWWHYLTVTVPDVLTVQDSAFLFIEGGANDEDPPSLTREFVTMTIRLAVSTGAVACNLQMVPNQPIVFKDDPSSAQRYEDAIIAWTWKKYVDKNGSDPEILLRMPMTKAVVRAMDTVTDHIQSTQNMSVNKFVIAGESKRGWTTWTTAAVDRRVIGFVPIVEDLLNMVTNLHHFYRAYGGWTFEFQDYYVVNFTANLDNPLVQRMAGIVDPISYNDRYRGVPKMIISATGDGFFLPDDSHFYFDQLNGPKYLRTFHNSRHSLTGHEDERYSALRSFFLSVATRQPYPEMTWIKQATRNGGFIRVSTNTEPISVACYYANTLDGNRRDFRLLIKDPASSNVLPNPVMWYEKPVESLGNNTYRVAFRNPTQSWLAFFVKVTFAGGTLHDVIELTTETLILPTTFPFPDCHGAGCMGRLV
ncbi:hypothetical protein ScPMuIL_003530 [Solemya velum]